MNTGPHRPGTLAQAGRPEITPDPPRPLCNRAGGPGWCSVRGRNGDSEKPGRCSARKETREVNKPQTDRLAGVLRHVLASPNEADRNGEPADVADDLEHKLYLLWCGVRA